MPTLSFKGKTAVETYHHTVPHHTLEFDERLSVLPKGEHPNVDGNLIIEGDNLLALKALLPTHAGKVKCIYIDPPYNTGNEGWVYNDNLTQPQFKEWIGQTVGKEGEDFLRHDKWCCMMYPRLQLLKELLHPEEGMMFVSIDDSEQAHLRLMMDEVFGAENWLATMARRAMHTVRNTSKDFNLNQDYVIAYARAKGWFGAKKDRYIRLPMDKTDAYPFDDGDGKGKYKLDPLHARNFYEPYEYVFKNGVSWSAPAGSFPRYAESSLDEMDEAGEVDFRGGVPQVRRYLQRVQEGRPPDAYLQPEDVRFNSTGTSLLAQILGAGVFMQPKPVELVEHLLKLVKDPNALVLDSFAGSGTTGHAVIALNNADGGKRRFVLIQQPYDTKADEKGKHNICEKVTSERVRRVIKGYTYKTNGGKATKVAGLGGSFTYARLSENPMFGQYKDFGDTLPSYKDIAKYVFYTETSRQWDAAGMDQKSGRIGEHGHTSYYLLYKPNHTEDWGLDTEFLKNIAVKDPHARLVVYCEKFWMHREELRKWEDENGKTVRWMMVPFDLK